MYGYVCKLKFIPYANATDSFVFATLYKGSVYVQRSGIHYGRRQCTAIFIISPRRYSRKVSPRLNPARCSALSRLSRLRAFRTTYRRRFLKKFYVHKSEASCAPYNVCTFVTWVHTYAGRYNSASCILTCAQHCTYTLRISIKFRARLKNIVGIG